MCLRSPAPILPRLGAVEQKPQEPREPERYEPIPGLGGLPAWVWGKMGRRLRIGLGVALVASTALALALASTIGESKRERAEAERRARAEQRAQLIRRLEAEIRPRFRRSSSPAPPGAGEREQLTARAGAMDEASAAILEDARRRVRRGQLEGPILRVDECEAFPRTIAGPRADLDLSRRRGRFSCVAVTAEFGRGAASLGGVIGHRYRLLVDFESGRYAFCKVSGQAGPTRRPLVTTPRACGG